MARIGRFDVSNWFLENTLPGYPSFLDLIKSMVILRREPSMSIHGVTEFLAEFSEFDDINEGEVIPIYTFIYRQDRYGTVTRDPAKRV